MDCLELFHETVLYVKGLEFELVEKRAENSSMSKLFQEPSCFGRESDLKQCPNDSNAMPLTDVFLGCVLLQGRKEKPS